MMGFCNDGKHTLSVYFQQFPPEGVGAKRRMEFNKKEELIMRDTILEILEDIGEDVDFDTCETLIDDGILSSLDIIQLIGALNDEFDISIPATEIIPENFNSVDAMAAMVARLSEE